MNIYITNLDQKVTDEELKNLFQQYGEVSSAEIVKDVFTEQSRGFGYVEMPNDDAAKNTIATLNDSQLAGRTINVSEAVPKVEHKGSYKVGNGPQTPSFPRGNGFQKRKGSKKRLY